MKKHKALLVCVSVLAGLTLANAVHADRNNSNIDQSAVTTSNVKPVNSSVILNNVANGSNAASLNGENVDTNTTSNQEVTVTASTQQARAAIPSYVNTNGHASGFQFGDDINHFYLYDDNGNLYTTPGWKYCGGTQYEVFEPGGRIC